MLRREARRRREYLYRKSLGDNELYQKKVKVREAVAAGKNVPTELEEDAQQLLESSKYLDDATDRAYSHEDDEYARANEIEPKVVITTSRDPSSRLSQFAKEVKLLFPNSQRLNRGNLVIRDLVTACKSNQVTDIILLNEYRGQPDGLIVSHLPLGPTAYFSLSNVVMRHDIVDTELGTVSEANPHLLFFNFDTRLGWRVKNILKYLFPSPKPDSRRIITFSNSEDVISFRHHLYTTKGRRPEDIELIEMGPRFDMKLYQIRLGTLDQTHADNEWVLRPYMNTAYKRRALSEM
jgi:U3 small nucleolar ribonucleoprotein protein IMP4